MTLSDQPRQPKVDARRPHAGRPPFPPKQSRNVRQSPRDALSIPIPGPIVVDNVTLFM